MAKSAGGELSEGALAPDFDLPSSDGRQIRLQDFRGRKSVVLYFYPKDDTPGCTREACDFRDRLQEIERLGAVVLGISLDDVGSHQQFARKYHLPFPLLSDADARVSKAYGVYKKKQLYGRSFWGIERTTFVIDPSGRVARIFPRVKVDGHTEAVIDFLKSRHSD